jgi:hypothetical protein
MVHSAGHTWLSTSTDVYLLPLVCEQGDRRGLLLGALETDTTNHVLLMLILEVEKSITGNLSLRGFTPTDRSKLGVAEGKRWTNVDEPGNDGLSYEAFQLSATRVGPRLPAARD